MAKLEIQYDIDYCFECSEVRRVFKVDDWYVYLSCGHKIPVENYYTVPHDRR